MDLRTKLRRLTKRRAEAEADWREAIREAAAEGMTRREIAGEVGVSFQRVQQIIEASDKARAGV